MPNITCADCKKEFSTRDEYMAHRQFPCVTLEGMPMPQVQKPKVSAYYSSFAKCPNGQFKCLKCNRYFDTKSGIGYHLSKIHDIRMTDEEAKDDAKKYAKEWYAKRKKQIDSAKEQKTDAVFLPNEPKTLGPMLVEPDPSPIPQKVETAKVLIKFCTKCNTIWDGAYSVKFCPDCGTELKEPLKRKTFQVVQ